MRSASFVDNSACERRGDGVGAAHTPSTDDSSLLTARFPRRMGFFQFSAMSLSWAPSLVFLAMGETTSDYRLAILVCPIFWLGGLAVLYFCVDVDTGLAEVEATLDKRFKSGGDAAPAPAPKAAPEKA